MLKNLENCLLFNGLKTKEIEDIFSQIPYQIKKYEKEEVVALSDTALSGMLILLHGSVRGEMNDDGGKTIKIEDIEPPNLLAPAFLFGSHNRYPVTIIANTFSQVMNIRKDDFLKLLQSNARILTNYLDNVSNRAQFLSQKLRFLSFHTIKGKLAHYFLQMARKAGQDEFHSPKSQSELADMFGVTRPSLSRAIREMDKDELILADGKIIRILDKKGLMDLLK
jgi:CRP/FNR family transcriptional regulator, dissimilatory nitrate respiration regulator